MHDSQLKTLIMSSEVLRGRVTATVRAAQWASDSVSAEQLSAPLPIDQLAMAVAVHEAAFGEVRAAYDAGVAANETADDTQVEYNVAGKAIAALTDTTLITAATAAATRLGLLA